MPSQTHYAASGYQSPDHQQKSTTLASVDALLAEIQSEIQRTMEAPPPHPYPKRQKSTSSAAPPQSRQHRDVVASPEPHNSPPRSVLSTYSASLHSHTSQSDSAVHISEDVGLPVPIARAASERRARPVSQYSMHAAASAAPATAAATPPLILFSGFLRKQTTTGIPGINPLAFKPRFLVLTDTFLYVFRSGNLTERAAEALPITIATTAAVGADGLWVLELVSKVTDVVSTNTALRIWKLQCSSRDEMVEWLAVLRSAIDRAKIVAVTSGKSASAYPNSNAGKGVQLDVLLGLAKPSAASSGGSKKGSVSSSSSSMSASTPNTRGPELMDTIRMLEDLELAHSNSSAPSSSSKGEHAPPPYTVDHDSYHHSYEQYAQPHQPIAPPSSSPSTSHLDYHYEVQQQQKHQRREQSPSSSRVQSHPVHPTQPPHHALHPSASQHVSHPPFAHGQQPHFHIEESSTVSEVKTGKQLKEEKKAAAKLEKEEKEQAEKEKKKEKPKKKPFTQHGVHGDTLLFAFSYRLFTRQVDVG
ncbi:hypothetical protein HDU87_008428 [Geranomyces variabilis]|uniref:PH domain-containing protein n=1 Tax=Geranomyces variabilis TaxID=109894 RepID=A0AAD5TI82_9FUNG|nr:hypothetical protein HDU87_008428 [Geranomyces variabilis]